MTPSWRAFLAVAGICVIPGCTVGPDYHPPAPPAGASAPLAALDPSLETRDQGGDAWWHLYADPELDHLVGQAFTANTTLIAADANLEAAQAVTEGARSALFPTTGIDASATAGRDPTVNEIREALGAGPKTGWIYESVAEMGYEVDLFGEVRRSIQAAEANRDAAAAARDLVKVTVAAETARGYAQICTLGEQLAVAQHSLAVTQHEAQITEARRQAGDNTVLDVARAQGLAAETSATIPLLVGERRSTLFELAALLGRTPANAPEEALACAAPPRLSALIPAGDGASLLRRRPDIRAAERRLAAATAQIGVATAALYPRVSLTGFWGTGSNQFDLLGTTQGLTWGIGPSISWSFPNQSGPRARIHQARANAAAALAEFDSTVLDALSETTQALARYSAEIDHRNALGVFQAKARQAYGLAHDQFQAGAISTLDLLTTEQSLVAADSAVAASDSAIVQDQIAVFKALGGGWQEPSREHRE